MNDGDGSQSLVDESAIRDLAVRYCTAVDRHDWDLLAKLFLPDDSGGTAFTIGGHYEDRLVRTPQGWKFKHRELVTAWTEDGAAS